MIWPPRLLCIVLVVKADWGPLECWDEPECFRLKPGESGFLKNGSHFRPFLRANETAPFITDAYWGLPAFYVRDHLDGREKWDFRGVPMNVYEKFATLPVRSLDSPYLLFFKPTFCGWNWTCPDLIEHLVRNRTDIIWVGHDLTGMKLTYPGHTLPGITIPGELGSTIFHAWRFRGQRTEERHEHFLTFQGKCPSSAHAREWYANYSLRGEMNGLFNVVNSHNYGRQQREGLQPGIKFTCIEKERGRVSNETQYDELLNSTFALVPKGDERWSFRFLETVGAGAIPVVVADGLTLPFENLVDWEQIVVRVPEADVLRMESYQEFLAALPRDPQDVQRRQRLLRQVNDKWFKDGDAIKDAFRLSIRKYVLERQRLKHVHVDYDTYVPPKQPVPTLKYHAPSTNQTQANHSQTPPPFRKSKGKGAVFHGSREEEDASTANDKIESTVDNRSVLFRASDTFFKMPKKEAASVDYPRPKRPFEWIVEVESLLFFVTCGGFIAFASLTRRAQRTRKTKV